LKSALLLVTLVAASAIQLPRCRAADSADLEVKLTTLESRIAHYISGTEEFVSGLSRLEPRLRQIGCNAYPAKTSAETIAIIRKEIKVLEEKDNYDGLTDAQKMRLQEQKARAATLSPTVDCSKL